MLLNSAKVFAGIMLMIGAAQAQAQVSNNDATPLPPSAGAIRDPNVRPWPVSPGTGGHVVIPQSSIPTPGDAGKRAHTNTRVFVPNEPMKPQASVARPLVGPPFAGTFFETPASLACIYGLVAVTPGCDPNTVTTVSNRGSKVVVVVDAFDNPSALADLTLFSIQFGLPAPTAANFQVVYATGVQPTNDTGWALEEALDIEMAHAMAPNAKVILVEAASDSNTDLVFAEDVASGLVAAAGGGEVSNSWGGDEFAGQLAFDPHFSTPKVVYFASTGDTPGVSWPSTSVNVVAVGGTSTSRWPSTGAFRFESSWSDGGGGSSAIVPRPAYQNSIRSIVGTQRGVPDISADANPITGVWVACGPGCGQPPGTWYTVGGTSVSSPLVAAMTNGAGRFAPNTASELRTIYANSDYPRFGPWRRFNNVVHGICGPFAGYATNNMNGWVPPSWDYCTGVGSPKGLSGL
jgi:kumamolisin